MTKKKTLPVSIIVAVALAVLTISCSSMAQQPVTKRIELQRHDISISGREAIQLRVDFAPGSKFGNHTHPGEEVIYVLEGLLEYEIEGKPTVTLKAGDVLFIPVGTIHSAKNIGTTNAAELGTFIVEKKKPLVVMIE
jgi:quercetin dioxygenase-like cupin family protein